MRMTYLLAAVFVAVVLFSMIPPGRALVEYIVWRCFQAEDITRGNVQSGQALIHYQAYGHGIPVILLHGGASQSEVFMSQIPVLSKHFRVIAIDSRGQGRSSRGTLPLTYRNMAVDVFQVMDTLGVTKADVVGWSDGGITGLMMTLQHPERIGRLVAISANRSPEGIKPEIRDDVDNVPGFFSWLAYQLYSPHPDKWETISDELVEMWATLPEIDLKALAGIHNPVLLMAGEHDIVSIPHLQEMHQELPDSRLKIVNDAGHNLLLWHSGEINAAILEFLQAPDADRHHA